MILKKNNIAEYILYLWQIEDYLRAFPQQAEANQELRDLNEMMHQENIMEGGHLQLAKNALDELEDFCIKYPLDVHRPVAVVVVEAVESGHHYSYCILRAADVGLCFFIAILSS